MLSTRDPSHREWTPLSGGGFLTYGWNQAFGGVGCVYGVDVHDSYRPHSHHTYVVAAIERGAFTAIADDISFEAGAGSVVVFSPNQIHGERWGPGTFAAIYPSTEVVSAALGHAAFRFNEMAWARPCFHAPQIAALVLRVRDLMLGGAPSTAVEEHLRHLLRTIEQWAPPFDNALLSARAPILALRDRLQAELAERPHIAALARTLNISEYHMIRVFRDTVGLPPLAYWEAIRVAFAKEMLVAGRSLRDVTDALGFSDQSHFTRHFKRTVRLTPGAYARMVRGAVYAPR